MARADLLKQLFTSFQQRDEPSFRAAAAEIIDDERKKHHPVLANELQRILNNGSHTLTPIGRCFDPVPTDSERQTALLSIRNPDRYLDDLILQPMPRVVVERVMREFRSWEVLDANGLPPVQKVLFCGPSGCGKTATAEAVATEMGLPLLYARFDSVVSSLLGETAANLRKIFTYAERGQWILFFDEFDAIGRSRDDATEHGEIKRVVNSFLQLLDNFHGRTLVIAATNFEQALDPALWRRFDDVIRFELPTTGEIFALVERRLGHVKRSKAQIEALIEVLSGGSFADAERLCFDLRKLCALDGRSTLSDQDVAEAIVRFRYRQKVLGLAGPASGPPAVDRD